MKVRDSSNIEPGASVNDPTITSLLEVDIKDPQSSIENSQSSSKKFEDSQSSSKKFEDSQSSSKNFEDSQSSSSTKDITVNLVLSSSSIDTWHVRKDIPLTTWIRHNNTMKKHLLNELGNSADDAMDFLEKSEDVIAAKTAAEAARIAAETARKKECICAKLANCGINKLSQWEKLPVDKHKDILSEDMLLFLSMRVSEWREKQQVSEWREKQWNEFLTDLVQKEKKVPAFYCLTQHHNFTTSSGQSTMLGEDRSRSLDMILKQLSDGFASTTSSKERNPIHSLIAQPRQGKSLFLDVVCEHVRNSGQFAICISYNSGTPYHGKEKESLSESFAWYFWARVVHAIVNAVNKQEIRWETLTSYPFLPCLTIRHVRDLINMCLPSFADKCILFAADEFSNVLKDLKQLNISDSKRCSVISSVTSPIYSSSCALLVSGFETRYNLLMETLSTRPVENYWLRPVTSADRKHYQPLIKELKEYYKDNDFPFLLYEWTKFSPGLLGLWLERLKKGCKLSKIEDLCPPVLQQKNCSFQYKYQYPSARTIVLNVTYQDKVKVIKIVKDVLYLLIIKQLPAVEKLSYITV